MSSVYLVELAVSLLLGLTRVFGRKSQGGINSANFLIKALDVYDILCETLILF